MKCGGSVIIDDTPTLKELNVRKINVQLFQSWEIGNNWSNSRIFIRGY